jgi:hypothetical protein
MPVTSESLMSKVGMIGLLLCPYATSSTSGMKNVSLSDTKSGSTDAVAPL